MFLLFPIKFGDIFWFDILYIFKNLVLFYREFLFLRI